MRTIVKNPNPPRCLARQPNGQNWEEFSGTLCRQEVFQSLLLEQKYLCCYCESTVKEDNSHIEHLVPRDKSPQQTYDYANLAGSCNGNAGSVRHCGHHKGREYNEALFASPHNHDTSRLFRYLPEGDVLPVDNLSERDRRKAEYMIKLLNLNCPKLKRRRNIHADNIIITLGHNPDQQTRSELEIEYLQEKNGRLNYFHSLSRQLLQQ